MELKEQYKQAFIKLRPRGKIWQVKKGGLSDRELDIYAEAFAKLHTITEQLFDESLLTKTKDFLEEWEDVFGLLHEGSYEDRILALAAAATKGSQSIQFYKTLAVKAGVEVEITEHCPFMFGASSCGVDELGAEDIIYYWEMNFQKGTDENIAKVRRLVEKYKQSHTILTFRENRDGKD